MSAPASLRPLRALVIGAGPMANHTHLPIMALLRDAGDLALTCICDIRRERAAAARQNFGFLNECSDALSAIERDDIDAVYIFGSAQMHFEYGRRALVQSKHLFIEKPVSPTFAEARQLADNAQARNLIAVAGHNRRFYRSFAALRQRNGKAGWQFAEAVFHKPVFGRPPLFGARNWLAANGIHALDALLFAMGGLPDHLAAIADGATPETSNAFSAIMRWRDGRQATFLCNNNAGARHEEYAFHTPGETCRITEETLVIEAGDKAHESKFPAGEDSFAAEHHAFLDAIRTGAEPSHSISNVAPSLFLCELIERGFVGPVCLPASGLRPAPRRRTSDESILVVRPEVLQGAIDNSLNAYRLVTLEDVRESQRERPDVVAAILGRGAEPLTHEILAKLTGLRVLGVAALSLARYSPDALLARDIAIVNASTAYAQSVAEFALGLAILGRRLAFSSHENMRRGKWGTAPSMRGAEGWARRAGRILRPTMEAAHLTQLYAHAKQTLKPLLSTQAGISRDLSGARVGLIGWGANARAFADLLRHFNVRVVAYSEHAPPDAIRAGGAISVSLGETLSADIVSLHRGLTDRTQHFLGAAELDRLQPGAVLINVARGALIDPEALMTRLRRGDVFACLDTFEDEPLPTSHPLRRLPNVFLTSHIAGGSPDMHDAAAKEVVRKVVDFLQGDRAETIAAGALRNMT